MKPISRWDCMTIFSIMCIVASLHIVLISCCAVIIAEGRLTGDAKLSVGQHHACPVWTVYNCTSQQCKCSKLLEDIVECHMNNQSSVHIRLKPCYCLSRYCTNESDCSEVVSNCPFSCSRHKGKYFS